MNELDLMNGMTEEFENNVYEPTREDFELIGQDIYGMEQIARPSIHFFKDAMIRLRKNKVAVVCAIMLLIIILGAIFVPMLSPYDYSQQFNADAFKGMFYKPDGRAMHIFGTDDLGRDLFVRVWEGARTSLFIAVSVVAINCIIGLVYGGISGYFGGVVDNIMMRIIEVISGIPYLMVIILLSVILPRGIMAIIIAYSVVGWTSMARLVRGQILTLKEQEFVVAAKAMGAGSKRIIVKHLIPNILSVVIVNITLSIPSAIFTEAFLSYIGLGVPTPMASWGTLANDGAQYFQQHAVLLLVPAIMICITMLCFNLLGDALRDAFDPKLRR